MTSAHCEPLPGMPHELHLYEVGPRDGLQNEKTTVPVHVKAEFVRRLLAAGLQSIEITSFVHPRWVPQLADATELLTALGAEGLGPNRPVLVPNENGLNRALDHGVSAIAVFGSATETFSQRNLNRSMTEAMAMFTPVISHAKNANVWVRAYISMCFGDPWEGPVPIHRVVDVAHRFIDLGVDQLSLGDTIGVATPGHVVRLLDELAAAGIGPNQLAVHFHDTYGQALTNTLEAIRYGVTTVDTSAGGLGGCPYAASATGNLATEDLLWALDGMGIHTGVDLPALADTSRWMAQQLGRPPASKVVTALAGGASDYNE
ncbi:Hydroxymethylglutaryl-CoA lyase YngG [Austwickia sp. TVS 96-490-7B]|uniref:hydroxymethylglutaryl-CoA lyase n=1 Tax=Austwickia sp. TVS 96-490-7B TaxID=2830843 RepID=UPI001D55E778|nr:hydroxymethylglutaryl-CoA lyase [Austwickia sp. TVS 96-490-7B]MBW3085532.1 Hydroxymethylglutaryl-CoA lyase YngG [Austwickia sp. TVS 96-490-7B]